MAAPAVIEHIVQKDGGDCVLASVAMILGLPYAEVSAKALELWPDPHTNGLTVPQTQKLVKALRGTYMISMPATKHTHLEEETGVLFVTLPDSNHAMALFEGVIVNPADGLVWNPHTYMATKKARPYRLLKP